MLIFNLTSDAHPHLYFSFKTKVNILVSLLPGKHFILCMDDGIDDIFPLNIVNCTYQLSPAFVVVLMVT